MSILNVFGKCLKFLSCNWNLVEFHETFKEILIPIRESPENWGCLFESIKRWRISLFLAKFSKKSYCRNKTFPQATLGPRSFGCSKCILSKTSHKLRKLNQLQRYFCRKQILKRVPLAPKATLGPTVSFTRNSSQMLN